MKKSEERYRRNMAFAKVFFNLLLGFGGSGFVVVNGLGYWLCQQNTWSINCTQTTPALINTAAFFAPILGYNLIIKPVKNMLRNRVRRMAEINLEDESI